MTDGAKLCPVCGEEIKQAGSVAIVAGFLTRLLSSNGTDVAGRFFGV
jgi:hypothetical protein